MASAYVKLTIIHAVVPVVEITATNTLVSLGDNVIITCSVQRGNPSNYNYTITNINTGNTTTGPTFTLTGIEITDVGTYRCDVTNIAGTGSTNVTIELGGETTTFNVTVVSKLPLLILYELGRRLARMCNV